MSLQAQYHHLKRDLIQGGGQPQSMETFLQYKYSDPCKTPFLLKPQNPFRTAASVSELHYLVSKMSSSALWFSSITEVHLHCSTNIYCTSTAESGSDPTLKTVFSSFLQEHS